MDVERVRAEARTILDRFGKQLESVKISSKAVYSGSEKGVRNEKKGVGCDEQFKATMFKNAPKSDSECLILEKGAW